MAGSRPGGLIAQSWAAMVSLGQQGYLRVARSVLDATMRFRQAVLDCPGVELVTEPEILSTSPSCRSIVKKAWWKGLPPI